MANQPNASAQPTCFVVMPIADVEGYEPGHFGRVYEHLLRPAISQAGYNAIRADDTNKTDYIVVGIIQRIVESDMVLCDLSARNANVMYELGIRHAFNKTVTLIKDKSTEKIFDIQGLRYTEYSQQLRVDSVQKDIDKIAKAITDTAAAKPGDVNSVIQLAGLRPAEVPAAQTVSPETQIVLSAIASLEARFESAVQRNGKRFFRIDGDAVVIAGKERIEIGREVYDGGRYLGELTSLRPDSGGDYYSEQGWDRVGVSVDRAPH
jgi:hypothetical protein